MAVQLRRVCGTVMPKYWFTIQKPASLTWERHVPPQHKARTIISGVYPGIDLTSGATIPAPRKKKGRKIFCGLYREIALPGAATFPAAVMIATVAEPCAARMAAAT